LSQRIQKDILQDKEQAKLKKDKSLVTVAGEPFPPSHPLRFSLEEFSFLGRLRKPKKEGGRDGGSNEKSTWDDIQSGGLAGRWLDTPNG
jgi:hypothetical protein